MTDESDTKAGTDASTEAERATDDGPPPGGTTDDGAALYDRLVPLVEWAAERDDVEGWTGD
jgi:hypothetical protein